MRVIDVKPVTGPVFIVEDSRAPALPDDHDRATELEFLGEWYTHKSLMGWRDMGAWVVRYEDGVKTFVGLVDDILSGKIRPPLEVTR